MENKENNASSLPVSSDPVPTKDPNSTLYVLLVVLIICGGNGIGIISAALLWKFTGAVAAAILTAVAITLVAFVCGMLVIKHHNRKK